MIENVRQALRKVGSRADALGTCPVCGDCVRNGDNRVRVWQGTFAHSDCASFRRDRRHSHRVHDSFTAP